MASRTASIGLIGLPNPATQRVERDRAIAFAHIIDGLPVQKIVTETGVNYRTAYRAISREREWAEAQKETPPGDTGQG